MQVKYHSCKLRGEFCWLKALTSGKTESTDFNWKVYLTGYCISFDLKCKLQLTWTDLALDVGNVIQKSFNQMEVGAPQLSFCFNRWFIKLRLDNNLFMLFVFVLTSF